MEGSSERADSANATHGVEQMSLDDGSWLGENLGGRYIDSSSLVVDSDAEEEPEDGYEQNETIRKKLMDDSHWVDLKGSADEQELCVRSLFDDTEYSSPEECLAAMRKLYEFDLNEECARLGLDLYGRIRLVNYLRSCSAAGVCPATGESPAAGAKSLSQMLKENTSLCKVANAGLFEDDKYMKPVIADDPLLLICSEDDDEDWEAEDRAAFAAEAHAAHEAGHSTRVHFLGLQ